jgi:hypothetical protein
MRLALVQYVRWWSFVLLCVCVDKFQYSNDLAIGVIFGIDGGPSAWLGKASSPRHSPDSTHAWAAFDARIVVVEKRQNVS